MTRPAAVRSQWWKRARLAPLLAVTVAGCVTTYESKDWAERSPEIPHAVPVVLPISGFGGGGDQHLRLEFYSGILRRLQDAADDGDIALLDSLVASYAAENIPEGLAQSLASYRAIGRGLRFRQHAVLNGVLELRPLADGLAGSDPKPMANGATPSLGSGLRLDLRLPPMKESVVLGGLADHDPISFNVALTVDDEYVDGSLRSVHTDGVVWLPQSFELGGDDELRLPIDIDVDAGDAVRRQVLVRIDVRGHVLFDGIRSPVKTTTIAAGSYTQWPQGFEIIAEQPLAALKQALAAFESKNFASVYIAAVLMPPEQQQRACALLIDPVRFGRLDQAQVAMAALQKVSGLSIAVGDRDSWLRWWQGKAGR